MKIKALWGKEGNELTYPHFKYYTQVCCMFVCIRLASCQAFTTIYILITYSMQIMGKA